MMNRWYPVALTALLTAGVLAGCQLGTGEKKSDSKDALKTLVKPLGENEQASLKVYGDYMNESNFIQNYGNSYLVKYPNVDVSFVTRPGPSGQPEPAKDPLDDVIKLIEDEKPDILFLQPQEMEKLGKKGMLYELDPLAKEDKFDLQNIHNGVMEALRVRGNGKLYGLTPFFSGSALFYNKDLFDKFQVSYPKDQMSWEELYQLARRFPAAGSEENREYGLLAPFSRESTGFFSQQLAHVNGLSEVDAEGRKVTINTEPYKKVWNLILAMSKSEAVYMPGNQERNIEFTTPTLRTFVDPFVAGKTAMAIESNGTMQTLAMLKDGNLKPFNWQLVTAPVDPQNPNESAYYNLFGSFAINAKSANVRAAWQLVKYWNSDEYAAYFKKALGSSYVGSYRLMARVTYNKPVDGRSMEPFYKLRPSRRGLYEIEPTAPLSFYTVFNKILTEESNDMMDSRKTIDEGLASIQERGQMELDSALAGEAAKKGAASAK